MDQYFGIKVNLKDIVGKTLFSIFLKVQIFQVYILHTFTI